MLRLPSFRRGGVKLLRRVSPGSPRFDGGSGLKQQPRRLHGRDAGVSPRFDGGSGLKHVPRGPWGPGGPSPLVSTGGAD